MKYASIVILTTILIGFTSSADAYLLPKYEISKSQMESYSEDVLTEFQSQMDEISRHVQPGKFEQYEQNKRIRLSKDERKYIKTYRQIQTPLQFWTYVVGLKKSLVALLDVKSQEALWEADLLAKTIIETVYKISQEYRVDMTALFRNFEINSGDDVKGFCYHYVTDILKVINKRKWDYFDFHWGEAHAKTWLENNALIITAKKKPFEIGIVFDAWRTAGKPFWKKVKEDSFPWKKAPTMRYE